MAGPVAAALLYAVLPETYSGTSGAPVVFTPAGRATVAAMAWMAMWWLTEAIPISATALLPVALFPVLGVSTMGQAAAPYGSDLIFLFMGGFILALSMERWGLDRRIALVTLRAVGTEPRRMIAGFMLVTAGLSLWVSNTATAAMMLPIALGVVGLVLRKSADGERTVDERNFALCLMLGIAYAASIGGVGTIVGSPPNGIVVKFIAQSQGREVTFLEWMAIGMPFVIVFLPLTFLILLRLFPFRLPPIEGGRALLRREHESLGPMKPGEWITLVVFGLTAVAWIARPYLLPSLSDAGIAMIAGLALFLIPVDRGGDTFTMNWTTAEKMPWGVLVLFGGGLSLAAAVQANGVADFIGSVAQGFGGWPVWLLVGAVVFVVIFLTELTSNTATTATLVPVLAGLAPGLAISPDLLTLPAAIAASCAFMLPAGTPPNAIVFASGHVTIPQMCRAGLVLNLAATVLITGLALAIL